MSQPRFAGKHVVVTGATSGIGRAGALKIAREGGVVVATGRDEDRLASLRSELGPRCIVLKNDAAEVGAAEQLRDALTSLGPIHGLWLNAGYAEIASVREIGAEMFDRLMAANVRGPVLQMAALEDLLADDGAVLLTSSTSAYEGSPAASIYAATKGALVSLARCWSAALGSRGIRVNTLVPGPIDTEFRSFMPHSFRKDFETDVVSRLALGRIGTADEAASAAAFLLSNDSSYITGAQLLVDGGLVMH